MKDRALIWAQRLSSAARGIGYDFHEGIDNHQGTLIVNSLVLAVNFVARLWKVLDSIHPHFAFEFAEEYIYQIALLMTIVHQGNYTWDDMAMRVNKMKDNLREMCDICTEIEDMEIERVYWTP